MMSRSSDSSPTIRPPPRVQEQLAASIRPESHRPAILILEDDPAVARAIRRMLSTREWDYQIVGTLAAVRRLSDTVCYEVAVLDLQLPDGSGVDAGRQLLERGLAKELVFFSAHIGEAEDAKARKLGNFIHKSEGPERLRSAVQAAIEDAARRN